MKMSGIAGGLFPAAVAGVTWVVILVQQNRRVALGGEPVLRPVSGVIVHHDIRVRHVLLRQSRRRSGELARRRGHVRKGMFRIHLRYAMPSRSSIDRE